LQGQSVPDRRRFIAGGMPKMAGTRYGLGDGEVEAFA
jgi:hypothetical protein